jgi:AraC family transcriptional regulator
MSVTKKALWIIARNDSRDLDLCEIAAAAGVSKYHLAHAFAQTVGLPVMQYLRGRRLTAAARALAGGAPDILQVALEAGYGSHEAFTRAFRAQFGLTPEELRARGSLEDLTLLEQPDDLGIIDDAEAPQPEFISAGDIRIVGLSQRHPFDDARGIPAQWQRFMAHAADIPNRLPGVPIGVASSMDGEGALEYVCAVEVKAFGDKPKGFVQMTIRSHRYAIFEHRGHISALSQTYAALWDRWLPALRLNYAGAPCIERHKETFDPATGEGGVDLWIPIDAV